ncbi:MAG: non-homologous end-joining DNA ligase [Patescibacteria group bacterium]
MQKKLEIPHGSAVMYPKDTITKKEVVSYYEKVAPYLLAHAKERPTVMQRFPEDITQAGFYQKEVPSYFPSSIKRVTVTLKGRNEKEDLVLLHKASDLVYLASQRVLCFHTWLSNKKKLNYPDKVIFDLDPTSNNTSSLKLAAVRLKGILEEHGLVPFVMTTGSRGYHIVAPVKPEHSFDDVHNWAKEIAQSLADTYPSQYTTQMQKKNRGKRIFIDYLRNSYAQTGIAPYSLRALAGAPVATPITWKELAQPGMHPQKFTIKNIFARISKKGDAWRDFHKSSRRLKLSTPTQ